MATDKPRKSSRGWIWYFVILGALSVLGITILVVYNLRQQLKPEQIAAARKLWEEKRPPDYVLTYTKKGDASGTFIVTVHQGKVVSVIMREEVVKDNQVQVAELPLERRLYASYDMAGLFDNIERFQEMDARKDSPRTFIRATFDPQNGQLLWFVRRVMGTRDRIEINVEPIDMQPAGAAPSPPRVMSCPAPDFGLRPQLPSRV